MKFLTLDEAVAAHKLALSRQDWTPESSRFDLWDATYMLQNAYTRANMPLMAMLAGLSLEGLEHHPSVKAAFESTYKDLFA